VTKLYDPKNLGKPQIRLSSDEGMNPYDSATPIKKLPPKDWQIAGRGWEWWFGIIGLGVVFGLMAYFKTKT
jgi:hypothetical protein